MTEEEVIEVLMNIHREGRDLSDEPPRNETETYALTVLSYCMENYTKSPLITQLKERLTSLSEARLLVAEWEAAIATAIPGGGDDKKINGEAGT